jgi:aminopeptidase N
MPIQDSLLHPALIDPRQWGEIDLYGDPFGLERSPLDGPLRATPDLPYRIDHLRLTLRIVEEAQRIEGIAELHLRPLSERLSRLELDAAEMEFGPISIVGKEDGQPVEILSTETRPERLILHLAASISRETSLTVTIPYQCRPRKGLFFIQPTAAQPDKPRQIWTQGQNEDAHWWFPCHDVPNQKMTTELIVTLREDWSTLSNGRLLDTRENPDGTRTWHWRQDQPHPAYLVTLVAGHYHRLDARVGELPLSYYVYPDRVEAGQTLFARTPEMVTFFAERFGHAYPYDKYAQVLVDDFLFGAMENTSATTMTDRCLLDEAAQLDLNYDDIVAHELAHHWWGDLVTCKDWSQIWLNESFATYAEFLWREETQGRDAARWALFQDFLVYLREDLTSHRRPLVCRQYHLSEEVMDRHAYEKGACVLAMLRDELGDDAFFRSLSHYLHRHAHGVAETYDLRVAIEEATGRNLSWFFDQWILGAGYPELDVASEWQAEAGQLRLDIRQCQAEEAGGQLFRLPVEVEITLADETRGRYRIVVEQARQSFYFPCTNAPRMVLFDKGERIFKRMRFEKSAEELAWQLSHAEEMMDRLRAARDLANYRGSETMRRLANCLREEPSLPVRLGAVLSLGQIGGEESRVLLKSLAQEATEPALRRTAILALGTDRSTSALPLLRQALELDPSYFVRVATVRALANLPGDEPFEMLTRALSQSSWQEVVAASVLHGLRYAPSPRHPRALELVRTSSGADRPLPVRLAAISCLGTLGKEMHAQGRLPEREPLLPALLPLLQDPHPRVRATTVRALAALAHPQALPHLQALAQHECLDLLRSALREAIHSLTPPS